MVEQIILRARMPSLIWPHNLEQRLQVDKRCHELADEMRPLDESIRKTNTASIAYQPIIFAPGK